MKYRFEVGDDLSGYRLDQLLVNLLPDYSRTRLQKWIKQGRVLVSGQLKRAHDRITVGAIIVVEVDDQAASADQPIPQNLPLDVIAADDDLIVINKPANQVVYQAPGHPDGTLQNALLFHFPELEKLPRSGIVHRLDKDTTGLMVIAKSRLAYADLQRQLKQRTMGRRYYAVVSGVMISGGKIDLPIARHRLHWRQMAVAEHGKQAVTDYRIVERFSHHTYIQLDLSTGRTHQIRVHLSALRYPIVGDRLYAGRRLPPGLPSALQEVLKAFPRQALHAGQLSLIHPHHRRPCSWQVALPDDMWHLVQALRQSLGAGT